LRQPDFVIIGAMKAGTTTLNQWLQQQPEIFMPTVKEPHFFSEHYARGLSWYSGHFSRARPGLLAGEASASYTDPEWAARAAERMADVLPDAKLIFIVRDPVKRTRSHYLHEAWRGREHRLPEVAITLNSPYVQRSMYLRCLQPYLDRFPAEKLCVIRTESLNNGGWAQVSDHLGLPRRPVPGAAHNLSASRRLPSPLLDWVGRHGLSATLHRMPQPLRAIGKRAMQRGTTSSGRRRQRYAEQTERIAAMAFPADVVAALAEDLKRLEDWIGLTLT